MESFKTFGGTWHTHTFPGIRSDSDLYTFGYRFQPWKSAPIATAEEILKYMGEVITKHDLAEKIRYQHKVIGASWSSVTNLWTVDVLRTDTNEKLRYTANFLWMGQGYYKHSAGYTPNWPGMEKFKGRIAHPQTWSKDIDYKDKNVLVIGSGATTATIVPAMAQDCRHITVLQRSPTYFWSERNVNELADTLRQLEVDEEWIHEIVRRKVLFDQQAVTKLSFEEPEFLKKVLIDNIRTLLGPEFDVDKHFTPKYRPWQQRLAFVPNGDLFTAIKSGKASIVTDEIESFTENGVLLKSGAEICADLIVTATGFNLSVLGDIPFVVDGQKIDFAQTVTYRGMMFTGVPNMAWVFGYFRASWTLRVDLIGDFICRLLKHMEDLGVTKVIPQLRPQDESMPISSWMDSENFNPNYLVRSEHLMPKRGNISEWQHNQDYWVERKILPSASLTDGCLIFS